jgi:uncharacterized protein (TIGR02996 family)
MARAELLALLRAVKEEPEEDAPRLVLADWLEENGDEADLARAEFIRLQCEASRLDAAERSAFSPGRPREPSAREQELADAHEAAWLGPLVEVWPRQRTFERGLLNLRLSARALVSRRFRQQVEGTEVWAWVESLHLQRMNKMGIEVIAAVPLLGSVAHLDLSSGKIGDGRLELLLASRRLGGLRALTLHKNFIGDAGARLLAGCPALAGLRQLDLRTNRLELAGVGALLASPHLARLRGLRLAWNPAVGPEVARAAADVLHLPRLTLLDLDGLALAEGVQALARCPGLASLTTLWMDNNRLGDEEAEALASSPHLTRLEDLRLGRNAIGDAGAAALAGASSLAGLRALDLAANDLTDEGAEALAASPHLGRLTSLVVRGNLIGARGRAALLDRFGERVYCPSEEEEIPF